MEKVDLQSLEFVFKASADKNRIRILKLLELRAMCVCELAFILGIKQPSVSRHLKKLKEASLIDSEPDGPWTNYVINKNCSNIAKAVLAQLQNWLKDDDIILLDKQKADRANRARLCGQ